jgi:predicted phosphodiesterase
MTRIALLSDIHGHLPALELVMEDMRQFAPDHVVVAGDMVNGGPFSAEVMQVVYENRWTLVRGNNEYYNINAYAPRRPEHWSSFTLLEWLHDQLTDWHPIIAGLPDDVLLLYPDAPDVHLCHGIPNNCWKGIYSAEFDDDPTVLDLVAGSRAKTIFCGHTHIPLDRWVGEYHIINPGSVGNPLLGEAVASYMILDGTSKGWQVVHHRNVPIDFTVLYPAWQSQRFVERCGVTALMVIHEFRTSRMGVHNFMMWMREHHPDEIARHHHAALFLQQDVFSYMPPPYRAPTSRQYQTG